MLTLMLIGMLTLAFNIQQVKADWSWTETIYIRADGSVYPDTAPVSTVDQNTYTLTDNIVGDVPQQSSAIVVERDNIVVDGAGYTVQGTGAYASKGVDLSDRSNVTIKNTIITAFYYGILLGSSSNNRISGNSIANHYDGIVLDSSSNYNSISGNNITESNSYSIRLSYSCNYNRISGNNIANHSVGILLGSSSNYNSISKNNITTTTSSLYGIDLGSSSNNRISGNSIANHSDGIALRASSNYNSISGNSITESNYCGIELYGSSNNSISGNNITASDTYGILLDFSSNNNSISGNNITASNVDSIWLHSSNNRFYHNNFVSNTDQVYSYESINVWDDGYPSGGNYWSDYTGVDLYSGPNQNEPGSDGIGDTSYFIDVDNQDRYPFMNPWTDTTPPETTISLSGVLGDNDWFTSDVTVTLSATDNTAVGKTEYSFDNAIWNAYTTPFTLTNEGTTTVYYKSTDIAGNPETTKTKTIKIDKTIPSGAITINNDAAYATSTSVTLTLSAADATSGVYRVRFSNDGIWDTETWEEFSTTKAWTLTSGDGTKTVFYQIKDNAGLTWQYQDTVILDTTKPTANAGPDQTINEDTLVTLNASASTDENGIATYSWTFTDVTLQTLSGKNPTYTFATPGTYTITLKVTDPAGNTATDTITITVSSAEAFPMWIAGAAIAAIGIAIAAILLLRKRK